MTIIETVEDCKGWAVKLWPAIQSYLCKQIECRDCPMLKNSSSAPLVYCRFDSIVRYPTDICKWPNLRHLFKDNPDAPLLETIEAALG